MTTLVIQPSSADSFIDASAQTTNEGANTLIRTQPPASTKKILVQFDLSSINPTWIINSVVLRLYCTSAAIGNVQDIEIHRGLVSWVEAEVTWQRKETGVPWSGGDGGGSGVDYAATATDTTSVVGSGVSYDWDVTPDVQDFVSSAATNFGWWLFPAGGTDTKIFRSKEHATASTRPQLIVDYTATNDLIGSSTGIATVSGSLKGVAVVAGLIQGQATVSGMMITNEYLHGESLGSADVSGIIVGVGNLAGSAAGSSTASGDIQGEILLPPGIAEGTSTVVGDIVGKYYMLGESLGLSTASAIPSFQGQLRGSADGSSTVTAIGYAKAIGVAALVDCYPLPLFHITDGSYKDNGQQNLLNFLSDRSGYRLNNWEPTVAQFKDGGRWANSPTAQGRRLKGYVYDNAIEVLDLNLVSHDQNRAIQFIHDLWYFQQGVADYWSSAWSSLPIYLVGRAARERNTFYAIVHQISCPQLRNIFAQPFFDERQAAMDSLTIRIERGHWLSSPPGDFECVEISSIRSWTVASWQSGS